MVQIINKTISGAQLDLLQKFAERVSRFGGNFAVFDSAGRSILHCGDESFENNPGQIGKYAQTVCQQQSDKIQKFGQYEDILAQKLKSYNNSFAAIIDTGNIEHGDNENLRRLCSQHNVDYVLFERAANAPACNSEYFEDMLTCFASRFNAASKTACQLEKLGNELSQAYEELMLMYNMGKNMKVTQSNATYLQVACDQITELVNVGGIAVFLEKTTQHEQRFVLTAGSGLVQIDAAAAGLLQSRLVEELNCSKEALLDSEIDSPFKYDWPEGIESIVAVPLLGADRMIGMMVATNAVSKPDFDSIDAKLFNSVANQCAVFIENGRLFGDLKELFVGSLKALTNSIDAKDQYTRGHSERVAFISRWIAEKLAEKYPIEEEQIHEIYLSGLLHDIGKIGINEMVLRKKTGLTDAELGQIKDHPRIGASILADIKQMDKIVPGILHHHERIDGGGYPDGLKGECIPLMAKILCLADSFDAMTSKRVYRNAMSIKRALEEIEKSLGTQFDEEIGRVFIESDIRKLWNIIQDGFIESWDYSNFSEYGAVAVGSLVR